MAETGLHPEQVQLRDIALSEAGQQYCQHLVTSLISPHLDTSTPAIKSCLLRAFGEVLTNIENRVRAIFDRSIQSGEATAAEPEKCVREFQQGLHYMEEYLSTCFQTRNVNFLYNKMEVEEPATSGPQYRRAQRAMARIKRQLQEDLDVQYSVLLDGLVQHKLVRDWERDSILARATPRAKAEELLRTVTPRLDQTRLQLQFLPLLRQDHGHLAQALSRAMEEEEETGGSEVKCCVCRINQEVEVKRLTRHLSEISPSLDSDLSNPALSNASKMQRLKEEVSPEQVIESLREPYPALHQQFRSERVTSMECFCARLREAPTSDFVDGLGAFSVTDDGDVAQMSDLQSMLGDLDLKERAYHLGNKTRGMCLIINNKAYSKGSGLTVRTGSDIDVKKLSKFFTQLCFSVAVHEDLNAREMESLLKEIASRDHSEHDCFVCFILSQGESDQLFGIDGSAVSVKNVITTFHANRCISLAGKPKLFFIQACRGGSFPVAVVQKSGVEGFCAEAADIFVGFPCTENHFSFRNSLEGSWYINTLIEVLSKYGEQYDFQTCITMVTQMVASRVPNTKILGDRLLCQIPQSVSTLCKPLFLSQNSVITTPAPKFVVK